MQLNTLSRTHKNKAARQVGRGGTRGKTAGRGTKGQKARAGHKIRPEMRDMIKRIPKMRGRGVNSNKGYIAKPFVVNLMVLEELYKDGDTVSPATLIEKGLLESKSGKVPVVKILGTGEITKKIILSGVKVSASVKEKIEKAGGKIA